MKKFFVFTIFLMTFSAGAFPAEVINDIIAVVGDRPITRLELEKEKRFFKKRPEYKRDGRNLESRILDFLINRAIVYYIADMEAVKISDRLVEDALKREMEAKGFKNVQAFEKVVRQQFGFTIDEYREEIRYSLLTQNVLQLRVSVSLPSDEEVEKWFNQNRSKLGNKYKVSIIRISYNKNDVKDELRVNRLMNQAREEAVKNFDAAARKYSDHPTKKDGGSLGWVTQQDLYEIDPDLLNVVMSMEQRTGKGVSPVFVGSDGYYLVNLEAITRVKLEDVYEGAKRYLYSIKQKEAFDTWLAGERKRLAVIVHLENYQEPK